MKVAFIMYPRYLNNKDNIYATKMHYLNKVDNVSRLF